MSKSIKIDDMASTLTDRQQQEIEEWRRLDPRLHYSEKERRMRRVLFTGARHSQNHKERKMEFDGGVLKLEGRVMTLDIPKLLESMEIEDTPENRDVAVEAVRKAAREMMPNAIVIVRPQPGTWFRVPEKKD